MDIGGRRDGHEDGERGGSMLGSHVDGLTGLGWN